MAKTYIFGEPVTGSTNYASAVTCVDKNGEQSTVQSEVDKLWDANEEQNKNFNIKYDETTGMIYFLHNGEWKEWIQAREMSTEYVLYENSTNANMASGTKLNLSDALGNYTYYIFECWQEVGNTDVVQSAKISTSDFAKCSPYIQRSRSITAIDNVNKTVTVGAGLQDGVSYDKLLIPKRILAYGKKTIY